MNEATRNFIHRHREADVRQLALQGGRHPEVDLPLALEQVGEVYMLISRQALESMQLLSLKVSLRLFVLSVRSRCAISSPETLTTSVLHRYK